MVNRELTLKSKLKCYVKPMKDPRGVSPSRGNQSSIPTEVKRIFNSDSHRGQKNFFFTSCGSLIPSTRANAPWVFHGFHIALQFTLQS